MIKILTIRELEIIKAALEGDINYQRDSHNRNKPEFKTWLEDTEKLLKKVSRKLFDEKVKEQSEAAMEEKYRVYDDRTDEVLLRSNSKHMCISYMIDNYQETEDAPHIWLQENPNYEKTYIYGGLENNRKIEYL